MFGREELLSFLILIEAVFKFTSEGLLDLYGQICIHPSKLEELTADEIRDIKLACINLQELPNKNLKEVRAHVDKLSSKHRIKFRCQRNEATSNIVNIFECAELKDIRIGDNHIFSDMTTYQIDRLATVF